MSLDQRPKASQSLFNTPDAAQHTPQSSTSSTTPSISSPAISIFSQTHVSRSSASTSSIASSPPRLRDSFELFGGSKRLEDVREDPSEREEFRYDFTRDIPYDLGLDYGPGPAHVENDESRLHLDSAATPYTQGDQDSWSTTSSDWCAYKPRKSADYNRQSMTNRLASRFPSLSKRWKYKSAALPQLSIVTHMDATNSRHSSRNSSQVISPALSAISKHESFLAPSPIRPSLEASISELSMDQILYSGENEQEEEDQGQARTPLLPPVMTTMSAPESPVQSPLQSPSVASPRPLSSTTPEGSPALPSASFPILPITVTVSAKPSIASFRQQRSRANTTNHPIPEIPPLQMLDEALDPWSQKLGHANFNIHPEPYHPESIHIDTYREFRENWDQARRNYTKHLARTGEHYGAGSKVYAMTQEKWESIDDTWKRNDDKLTMALGPELAALSPHTNPADLAASGAILEKPVTRILVPNLDDSKGKFPELGDEDIVGPMSVAPARSSALAKPADRPTTSPAAGPRKRNFFRVLANLFSGKSSAN